jgi:hypothetical protein
VGYTTVLDTHFLNNEVYNCSDGLQLVSRRNPIEGVTGQDNYSGTIIDNNDFYLTNAYWSNCKGQQSNDGQCSFAENAIDIKAGAADSKKPVVISNNRMWGWNKTDNDCLDNKRCSGLDSQGSAISIHFYGAKNITINNNIIWQSNRGVSITNEASNIILKHNILHNTFERALVLYGDGIIVHGNMINHMQQKNLANKLAPKWLTIATNGATISCNSVYNGGEKAELYAATHTRLEYNRFWMGASLNEYGATDIVNEKEPRLKDEYVSIKQHTDKHEIALNVIADYPWLAGNLLCGNTEAALTALFIE